MKVQKLKSTWNSGFLIIYEFVINSDRKTISQRLLRCFIRFEVHIQQFLRSKILQISDPSNSRCVDYFFKSTKKMDRDNLDLLDKSKIPGHCGFPLANLHSAESLHFVPAPTVTEDHQNIAYYISQSSIFTLYKTE